MGTLVLVLAVDDRLGYGDVVAGVRALRLGGSGRAKDIGSIGGLADRWRNLRKF